MATTTTHPPLVRTAATEAFPEHADAAERLTFLLRYAVLAPSGHNTQPWLFKVDGDTVELHADRTQALPVVDPEDRALTISCGAALLNLRVALRRFGYRDDSHELLPERDRADLLARVHLAAGTPPSAEEEALFAAIPLRRTTRASYEQRPLPPDLPGQFQEDGAREGAWLHVAAPTERERIAELVAAGDRAQMGDKSFRSELASWIHPNRSRALRGVRGYGFGFGDVLSYAGPLVIRSFDTGNRQAAKDKELVRHAPLLTVLGTDGDVLRDWLAAGQAMQRILLRATACGLTSSFLNQPVEVDELRPRLAEAIGWPGRQPQLVMRFGYGPSVPPSPRTTVEDVLIARD